MGPTAWGFDIHNASDFQGVLPDSLASWQGDVEKLLILEKYDEARAEVDRRLAAARAAGDGPAEAGACHALAKVHSTQNEYADAKQAAEEALAKFRSASDNKGTGAALLTSAKIALDMKDAKGAEELAGEAASKYQAASCKAGEAAAHHVLARIHQREGNVEEALGEADKAQALFEKCGDKEGHAAALLVKGNIYLWNFRDAQDEACKLGREAAQLCRKVNRPSCHNREADALFLVSGAAFPLNRHREGLKAAKEAVQLHTEWGGPRAQASSLRAVAMGHVQTGDLAQAEQDAEQALALLRNSKDEVLLAEAMVVEALVLRQKVAKGDMEEVEEMVSKQREVLERFVKLEDEHAAALHRLELAQALQLSGDSAAALTEATIACEFFKSKELKAGQGMCMMTIAMSQAAVGDASTALETAKKAESLLDSSSGANEAAELVGLLQGQAGKRSGPQWAVQKGWGSYDDPKFNPGQDAPDAAGIKRSMYSDIIKTRIHIGDTPEPFGFDGMQLMYMDKILGVPMPFLRDVPPPPGQPGQPAPAPTPAPAPAPRPPPQAQGGAPAPSRQVVPVSSRPERPAEPPKAPVVIKPAIVGNDLLGGRYRDCPEEVHDRMVTLARAGAIPMTTLPQRQALERKKPTFHGHADWRDGARWGYIHPMITAPKDCKWQRASVGWKLMGPTPGELLSN